MPSDAPAQETAAPALSEAPEITVLVPVLDEEASVVELTERVTRVLDEIGRSFELVFVDDGSGDATVERVRELHRRDRRVKLVRLRRNFGKAAAISAGVENSRGRIVVTLDGDLQDVPEEIPRFLDKLEGEDFDLVSGWKQHRQDPASKRYPSKLYNWVTRGMAQIDLHDFNCGFKAYRREVLEQVAIYGELHRYIPVLASRRGFRVGEIKISHQRRRHGRSKYGWHRLYKGPLDLLTVLFITRYTRRPLHLFGVIGLIFMAVGFGIKPLSCRPVVHRPVGVERAASSARDRRRVLALQPALAAVRRAADAAGLSDVDDGASGRDDYFQELPPQRQFFDPRAFGVAGLRKNFLFLTQTYPRFDGDSSGPFIRELARGLVRAGDRVCVLTPHAPEVADRWGDGGVEVRSFRYAPERFELIGYSRSLQADETMRRGAASVAPLYVAGALRAIRRELKRKSYDLLHAHWVVPNGLVASLTAGSLPIAVGLHGSDVFMAEKPYLRRWVANALQRTSVLTGCSPELVERVCALGFDAAYARVIPYGVDGAQFAPDVRRRGRWRRQLGIPHSAPIVLSVGRMATKKGYQVLIEGLGSLMDRHGDVHLVLAGGGDRLEEFRAATADWSERVHFPGAVGHDDLPDLFRSADVFVLPAVHDPKGNVDGLPNVILEAMASALPVVATRVSGIPLAVKDGVNGYLVPEKDPAAVNQALSRLLRELPKAREMGAAGRRRATSELSWDAVAARYRATYDMALAAH